MIGIRTHSVRGKHLAQLIFSLVLLCLAPAGSPLLSQSFSLGSFVDTSMTESQYISLHLDKYITPEYIRRHNQLRLYQRTGYSNMLMDLLHHDALAAMIDYVRMSLHLDYSQNFGPIYYPSQTVTWFDLPFDRTFPEDPWRREWWYR